MLKHSNLDKAKLIFYDGDSGVYVRFTAIAGEQRTAKLHTITCSTGSATWNGGKADEATQFVNEHEESDLKFLVGGWPQKVIV